MVFSRLSRKTRHSTSAPAPARQNAEALTPAQALGNQIMQSIQPKLSVNAPNDAYEQEADQFASRVTSAGAAQRQTDDPEKKPDEGVQTKPLASQVTPLAQRAPQAGDDKKKEPKPPTQERSESPKKDGKKKNDDKRTQTKPLNSVQRAPEQTDDPEKPGKDGKKKKDDEKKPKAKRKNAPQLDDDDDEVMAQRKETDEKKKKDDDGKAVQKKGDDSAVAPNVAADIERMQHGGRPLDPAARSYFEPRFGADFSRVRVHDDADAARAAESLNAQAFTQGEHIFFNSGRYQPGDTPGRQLMAHELTHTLQQGAASPAAPQAKALTPPPARKIIQRQEEDDDSQPPPPAEPSDRELDPATFARLQQALTDNAANFPTTTGKLVEADRLLFDKIKIPSYKLARNLLDRQGDNPYQRQYGVQGRVGRKKGYTRGSPDQRRVWRRDISKTNIEHLIDEKVAQSHSTPTGQGQSQPRLVLRVPLSGGGGGGGQGNALFFVGTRNDIVKRLAIPLWGRGQVPPRYRPMQVEHLVELQLGRWQDNQEANTIGNMILLSGRINEPTGEFIRGEIINKVRALLIDPRIASSLAAPAPATPGAAPAAPPTPAPAAPTPGTLAPVSDDMIRRAVGSLKKNYHLEFEFVEGGAAPGIPDTLSEDSFWTKGDIESGAEAIEPAEVTSTDDLGSATELYLFTRRTGGQFKRMSTTGRITPAEQNYFGAPYRVTRIQIANLDADSDIMAEQQIGQMTTEIRVDALSTDPGEAAAQQQYSSFEFPITRIPGARYAGYIKREQILERLTTWRAFIRGASPITVDYVDMLDTGLYVRGRIMTDVPILRGAQIDWELRDGELRALKTFNVSDVSVPRPLQISNMSLTLAAGTRTGISAEGRIDFGIERVGQGFLEARAQTGTGGTGQRGAGFALAGGFDFDSRLFDPASIRMRYENGEFSGDGTIGIPAGKIRGIRSARLTMAYAQGRITADGMVQPTIPGVQEGTMNLVYSEAEGLVVSGTLQLAPNPAIRSGSLQARIERKPDGAYKVAASGTAEPAIPNVDSRLNVSYDDGAFDAEVTAEYHRGMLNGSLRVAATNRPVDPATGQPSGDPTDNITVYGGGSVTIRFSPWLQGTAGIKLLPNGEIEVSGQVALPSAVDIFPARRFDRNIFRINIDIPIVGIGFAGQNIGIFASIGGGLDLTAGIGPGQIRELSLGVTYNPAHEDETHITGHGELYIPADAGLRLSVRGGVGAGIPLVNARAGIELGGQLGLEGAARAAVDVDWSPRGGIVLDAVGEVFVQPKFKFDVSAFVEVTAAIIGTLYEKRWRLAQFEYGSDLRFGVRFPVHYEETRPFEISMDNLEFTVPEVDPSSILSGVLGL